MFKQCCVLDKTVSLILMRCKSDSHSFTGEGFPEHVQHRWDLRTNRYLRQAGGTSAKLQAVGQHCVPSVSAETRVHTTAFSKLREQNGAELCEKLEQIWKPHGTTETPG